jgi:Patatin-like phospholipase
MTASAPASGAQDSATPESFARVREDEDRLISAARERYKSLIGRLPAPRIGLALSGGGIRSATFCLGVLQGLAKGRRLAQFDYLSTVSGGGYVGSWLSAWIQRQGLEAVDKALRGESLPAGVHEAPELTWLRRHSNYLAPRFGVFSADTLTLLTTWLRNVLLNLIILVSFLVVVFLLPRLLLGPTLLAVCDLHRQAGYAAAWLTFFVLPLAIGFNLTGKMGDDPNREILLMNRTAGVVLAVIVPGVAAAWLGSAALFAQDPYFRSVPHEFIFYGLVLAGLSAAVWATLCWRVIGGLQWILREFGVYFLAYGGAFLAAAAVIALLVGPFEQASGTADKRAMRVLAFGTPALLAAFGVAGSVLVGLIGSAYSERSREWWSRMNTWFVIVGVAWLLVAGLSLYALDLLKSAQKSTGDWVGWISGAGWLGILLAILLAPKPERKEGLAPAAVRVAAALALFAVVAGLLVAIALLTGWAVKKFESTFGVLLVALTLLLFFGVRVDINKFSLHAMYKNRLTRCYLGASRQGVRAPHPFTGFDEDDDLALHRMNECANRLEMRPLLLVNTALNLTQGRNLAWQERKAASFALTPLHCGFTLGPTTGDARPTSLLQDGLERVGGYRSTESWASMGVDGHAPFSLGSAMAVSGAAVNTQAGMASSPALAFVATMFNARLGRWSPNPVSLRNWRRSGPTFGLLQLLMELFGHSDERGAFLNLSDGGHFDNLGVYELVRRGCCTIIAVDATADPSGELEDLANLVRKVRIDFGVRIDFSDGELSNLATKGYAFGSVGYSDGAGRIVLVKPTRAPTAIPVDVGAYAKRNPRFPHQTTVDQFFSESQFESYRELGERIVGNCLDDPHFRLGGLPPTGSGAAEGPP